jgi:nucleotide-binding universal stress UspA family protein
MVEAVTDQRRRELEGILERTKRELASVQHIETMVTTGQVAHEIVRAASEPGVDLLVVGARGVGGFKRLLLGSVSDAVIRHAPCSVLVVKRGQQ